MEEQSTSSVLQNNLRTIFDLCDQDRDGVIAVQDFERIGRDHFENAQVSCGDRLGWAWWYKKNRKKGGKWLSDNERHMRVRDRLAS